VRAQVLDINALLRFCHNLPMYVLIDKLGKPQLQDCDNFKAFKVVAEISMNGLEHAFAVERELGSFADGQHVWISEHWLRSQGSSRGEDWLRKFEDMIVYARSKGWVENQKIRAHLEYTEAS
jgi:hypothetical protein